MTPEVTLVLLWRHLRWPRVPPRLLYVLCLNLRGETEP